MKNEVNRAPWAKKKTFLFILALCAASAVWGTPKSGLIDGTYYIASKADLVAFANAVNGGQYSLNAVVTADIDMAHEQNTNSWTTPIGTLAHPYTGTFDGQCYEIKNFLIFRKGSDLKNLAQIGFFGAVSGATIKNTILSSSLENYIEDVSGCTPAAQAGILVGLSGGSTIDNCQVSANLFTNVGVNVGGIVGYAGVDQDGWRAKNTISRCSCAGKWRTRQAGNYGGIVGYIYYVNIKDCYNLADITLNQKEGNNYNGRAGGIFAYVNSSSDSRKVVIENCYNYGNITNQYGTKGTIGAIAATANGTKVTITNCYYLSTSCGKGIGGTNASLTATSKSASEFKSLATSLGDEFVDGTDYPVLVKLTPALAFETSEFEVIAEAKSSIENSLVDLVEGAYPNFGTLTYSMTGDAIGTLVDGTANVNLNGATGTATITASVAGSNYYKEAVASYTITVKEPPTPVVTFPYLTGNKKTVNMDQVPFTESISVKVDDDEVSEPTIIYESSNEEVAIIKNNEVNIIGEGTATITAEIASKKGIYAGTDVYYTLTVEDKTPAEKQWTETFPGLSQSSYHEANPYKFTGKDGIYSWAMRTFRCQTDGTADKVGDDQGIRIKYGTNSNYIEFDGKQEGGVKRVKFDWRQPGSEDMAADLNIKIDNTVQGNLTLHRNVAFKGVNSYNRNVFVKSNTKMTITVPTGGNAIIIGPITITPYLLYTTKTLTVKLANVQSMGITNEKLIDNTEEEGTIVYSVPEGNGVATIESATGKLTISDAGEVIVTAAWDPEGGDNYTVTTTYKLIVNDRSHREAKFASPQVTMKQGEDLPDNELTYAKASGESITINYASSDNTVAEIVNNKVVVRGVGMTTITATIEQTEDFYEDKVSYLLIVYPNEDANHILVEDYKKATGGLASTPTDYQGNFATWTYRNSRSKKDDNLQDGIKGFMFSHTNGDNKASSYFETTLDGGIKAVYFDWRQFTKDDNGQKLIFQIKLDDEVQKSIEYTAADELVDNIQSYSYAPEMKKNGVKLTFANNATSADGKTDVQGRIMMGPITIVPYLFYKTKSHKIDVVKGDAPTWTNTDLINNTEGDGTIVYSVPEGNGVATIDPESGEVTAEGNGITTVTATWTPADPEDGEVVATTYTLEVFAERLDAELTFDPEEITVGVNETTVTTPTLGNPHELTVKYSSSDENIATVDENSGEVTLIGVAGDVVISATSEKTDTYKEDSASYTIHVLLLTSEVTFPDLTDNKKTVNMDADPFTENISVKVNGEEVSKPTITYESSNENAARVNETTGEVTIISVGTTVITATVAPTETYAGTTASYTLKVEKGNIGDAWIEGFGVIEQKSNYIEQDMSVRGDSLNENDRSVYTWKIENYQRNTETADKVGEDLGIRLRARDKDKKMHDNHIMFDGVQEGGIKAIAFDWRLPGSGTALSVQYDVIVNGETTHFDYKNVEAGYGEGNNKYPYAQFFGVRKNTTLTISIPQNEVNQAVIFGPITIVPYLLFTQKTAEVDALEQNSYTYPADKLINNTGSEGAITYSMTSNTGAAINANTGDVDLTSVTVAGDETITATWGEVSTTFTLKVTAKTPDFTLENKTAGAFATICLPKKIDHVENATLWSINYGDKTAIEFVVADIEHDVAGMPYLVQVAANGNVNFYYGEGGPVDAPVSAEEANGFVGSLSEGDIEIPNNGTAILISGGRLRIAGAYCVLTQNHAYIDSNNLPASAPVGSAPRRTMTLYNPDAAPTGLGQWNKDKGQKTTKVLRDGQFYIIRGEKAYNVMGVEE